MKKNFEQMGSAMTRRFGSRSGMSLIEILIGMAVVSFLALGSSIYATMLKNDRQLGRSSRFNCNAHLTTFLARLRAEAGATRMHSFHPHPSFSSNRRAPSPFSFPGLSSNGQWAQTPEILSDNDVPLAGNATLIQSYVRAVNGLYNDPSVDYCSSLREIPQGTALRTMASESAQILREQGGAEARTYLQIQMLNLSNGQALGCGSRPQWVYPKGISDTGADNGFHSGTFRHSANYRNDVGFRVTVRATYSERDVDGTVRQRECEMSQRISYDRDTVRPQTPSATITAISDPANNTTAHRSSMQLVVNYPYGEPGVVLACRDLSTLMPAGSAKCYSRGGGVGSGPGPQLSDGPTAPAVRDVAGVTANQHGATRPSQWGASTWVPCERVTLCGRTPSASSASNSTSQFTISNSYGNLRSDCVAKIEVSAMDAAGNLHGATPARIGSSVGRISTRRPLCTNWCTPYAGGVYGGGGGFYAYFPGGAGQSYWQTEPCCVGHGCNGPRVSNAHGEVLTESRDPAL